VWSSIPAAATSVRAHKRMIQSMSGEVDCTSATSIVIAASGMLTTIATTASHRVRHMRRT
jgi:hypothetical protein